MAANRESAANSFGAKRLLKELTDITKHPPPLITARMKDENIWQWTATIEGPPGTPYEGGKFKLSLHFFLDYPLRAPRVKFDTKIYHANIDGEGNICLDILRTEWTPAISVSALLLSICSLLSDCNPYSPLRATIARLYEKDREKHDENARQYTRRYAMSE